MEQTSIQLPLELIIRIIPFLDDRLIGKDEWNRNYPNRTWGPISPSLIACSLVCHTWNDICRPLIFRSIYIYCCEDMDHSDFWTLHFKTPHICKYIRELCLSFSIETSPPSEWIHACLSRFTNLRKLELRDWSELGSELSTLLLPWITSMLATTGVKSLALKDWDLAFINNHPYLLLMMSACSTTLEDLMIDLRPGEHISTIIPVVSSTVVRLEALRRIELYQPPASFSRMITIECPNLEAFTTSHGDLDVPWEIPSWIPGSIPELNLQVSGRSTLPQFKRPIHPSRLTIQLSSFDGDIAWLGECINHLPFLDRLPQLTIKIFSNQTQLSFPESTRYEALHHLLQPLQRPTMLKHIIFTIAYHKHILHLGADELESIRMREVARLEEVFLPLKAGGLSVQLVVLLYWDDDRHRVLIRCSV